MKTAFYPKLAWSGIRKNRRLYTPYLFTCSGMTAMFYIIRYLSEMPALEKMSGGSSARLILSLGVWVVAVFALVFLFYTNSFLMRRRRKEFGLYNILGMGKKNLSMLYVQETLILYAASMLFGLAGGIALSKLAELGLTRLLNGKIHYDFTVNGKAILYTLAVFGIIFCLLFIWKNSLHQSAGCYIL